MMQHSLFTDDAELISALVALRDDIAWPPVGDGPDPAARACVAIEAGAIARPMPRRSWWRVPRRALVLALAALLALAAVAGAIGLGLPGLRIVLGGPSAPPVTPAPSGRGTSPTAPGMELGLGEPVTLADAHTRTGRIPSFGEGPVGPPDAVYLDADRASQVALVWAASATLPETQAPGVGLIVMSFDGTVESAFFHKALGASSTIEPVDVAGFRGFWISGDPHLFFYATASETIVDERRWVADALVWSDGTTTWRIETAQGRDAALDLAGWIAGAALP